MTDLIENFLKIESGEVKTFSHNFFVGDKEVIRKDFICLIKFITLYKNKCVYDLNYTYLKSIGLSYALDKLFNSSVAKVRYYMFNKQKPLFTYGRVPPSYWNVNRIKEAINYYLLEDYGTIDYNYLCIDFLKKHHLFICSKKLVGSMKDIYRLMSSNNYHLYMKRCMSKEDAAKKVKQKIIKNNIKLDQLTTRWMQRNGLSSIYHKTFNASISDVKLAVQ